MCGRFLINPLGPYQPAWLLIEKTYGFTTEGGEIYPQMEVPVFIGSKNGQFKTEKMLWGFPAIKGAGYHINARAETVAQKPTFASAFRYGRGLVPADGFFEWQKEKSTISFGTKAFLYANKLMYLAAVFTLREDGKKAFALITTQSVGKMEAIHNRMPVIIQEKQERRAYLQDEREALKLVGQKPFSDIDVRLMDEVVPFLQMNFLDE